MTLELNWLTAVELAAGYMKKRFSPVEVAKACLARIAAIDGKLNAMSRVAADEALAQAKASERRWAKGKPLSPIDGVPLLIKDILLVKGWPTLRGSKTIDPKGPWEHDAPSVARLREAGTVFLGMTTTPEFGWKGVTDSPLTGITRNPWNTEMTPGGSSGGSSAAVAAGYGPLSLGTDGGGSIRIPAGFAGIFGHKPSFGRVPAWPLSPFGTVAHVGPMTRTVMDSALMMNAISRPDARDWTSLPFEARDFVKGLKGGVKGLRVAYSKTLGYVDVDPEIGALVDKAVKVLKSLGARVSEVDPGFADPASTFRTIWWTGARTLASLMPSEKIKLLDKGLQDVVRQAKGITVEEFMEAQKQRGLLGSHMRQFMESYDLLLTPTLPIPAFGAGKMSPIDDDGTGKWVNWTPYTYPFNLTQQPAASVPCGFTKAGLPAGLHIIGRMFDDWTVMRAAQAYEEATDFTRRRPPV